VTKFTRGLENMTKGNYFWPPCRECHTNTEAGDF
jgi:hypothetical protein